MWKYVWRITGLALTVVGGLITVANNIVDDKKLEIYVQEEVDKKFAEMNVDSTEKEKNSEEAE